MIVEEANKLKLNVQSEEFKKKTTQSELDTIEKWFKNDKCPTCGGYLVEVEGKIKCSGKNCKYEKDAKN